LVPSAVPPSCTTRSAIVSTCSSSSAETVDHLVQGDEVRPLNVPMRLLRQQREVDRLG
jgi:hypothetical protein